MGEETVAGPTYDGYRSAIARVASEPAADPRRQADELARLAALAVRASRGAVGDEGTGRASRDEAWAGFAGRLRLVACGGVVGALVGGLLAAPLGGADPASHSRWSMATAVVAMALTGLWVLADARRGAGGSDARPDGGRG